MVAKTGYTDDTADHLVLDAGAFYKNYDVITDTGTLIGATQGGGEFVAKPELRQIPVDGIKGRAKGMTILEAWDVSIKTSLLEVTPDSLKLALAAADIDTATSGTYDVVEGRSTIVNADYIDNITWIGRVAGSNDPVIIQIFNALAGEGITLNVADKKEGLLPVTFLGHYDALDPETPPFKIYYPKMSADVTAPTVTTTPADAATAVAVSANIVWTFSESIRPEDINSSNFFVMKADGTAVVGVLSSATNNTVITFNPDANLTASTAHLAIATKSIRDNAGNHLAATNVTNFTTA